MTDATNRPDPTGGWPPMEEPGESINLLQYLNMLLRRRWLIIVGTLITVLAAGIILKLQTPQFQASVKILPSRDQAMSSRIDASFGMNDMGRQQGYQQADLATQYYQELINSFPFLEKIVLKKYPFDSPGKEIDLIEYLRIQGTDEADKINKAVTALRKKLTVNLPRATGSGASVRTMTISTTADNPAMAAAIPNAILDELIVYNQTVRVSRTSENRVFIENQLKETQALLKTAEDAYSSFQRKNIKGGPELEVERDRLKRNVTVQTEVYIQLRKQLELAKIEEQEKRPTIEVLERAIPPRRKFKPAVMKGVIMAGFLGLFAFCGLAFVLEMVKKVDKEDENTKEFLRNIEDIKGDAAKVGRILFGLKQKPPQEKKL